MLNPFNKAEDGTLKSEEQIREELKQRVADWKKEPVYHAKCEENDF